MIYFLKGKNLDILIIISIVASLWGRDGRLSSLKAEAHAGYQGMASIKVCQVFGRGSKRLFFYSNVAKASLRLPGVPTTHLEPKRVLLVLICTILKVLCLASVLDKGRNLVDSFHFHLPINLGI